MAIAPIINASFTSGNLSFEGRNKKKEPENISQNPNKAGAMVTVPVALLMALASCNSCNARPAGGDTPIDSETLTELAVKDAPETEFQTQNPQKRKLDVRYEHIDYSVTGTVKYQKTFKSSNGITYTMYYVGDTYPAIVFPDYKDDSNKVESIVFVPAGYKTLSKAWGGKGKDWGWEVNHPPDMLGIRIHDDRGEGKEWMGVIVEESICDEYGGNLHREEYEIPVPDDIADDLIDMVADDHPKFVYTVNSRKEFTKSEELLPRRVMERGEAGRSAEESTNKELNYKYSD